VAIGAGHVSLSVDAIVGEELVFWMADESHR
jgi:hypothetical protein